MTLYKTAVFVALVSLLIVSCKNNDEPVVAAAAAQYCVDSVFKARLEFASPVMEPIADGIHLTGSVEANPDNVVHYVSLVSGVITHANFSLGDRVSKGQVLAELQSTELSSLQNDRSNIESQIRVAEKKLQAVQSMFNDGISSQKELQEAKSELEILQSEKSKVASNLNLYSASSNKNVFQIKAPASGIITSKTISGGSQISAEGESLFTVSNLNEVWVMVNIYATNVSNIVEGMPVEIRTLSYPGEIFNGKIGVISQVYDQEERVLKARVVLQNNNFKLKPGMLVDVTAVKHFDGTALTVPMESIVFDANENYVVVYKSDCDFEIRKVEIASKTHGKTYITSGINADEKVVTKNQLLIYEQLKNFQN